MGGPLRGSGAPPSFAVDPSPRKEGKKQMWALMRNLLSNRREGMHKGWSPQSHSNDLVVCSALEQQMIFSRYTNQSEQFPVNL